MTEHTKDKSLATIDAALPIMRERARDHIHLMFLVDDFQRANMLNITVVEATASRFSGSLPTDLKENLEQKLTTDMLMLLEMARNLSRCGMALIAQAEKVLSALPAWDRP
jgi:hypothetical protein